MGNTDLLSFQHNPQAPARNQVIDFVLSVLIATTTMGSELRYKDADALIE